ncbi:MAG: hypothetical protein ACO0C9_06485 [Candidatus Methanosuratincola verstraetei]|uniref:Thaumarchaeal output domain-containing protein n=1 Tax=Methanosuratincola subterraneus TaxID=2593994 RepID=A0A444L8R7_METS7|nr:MAG: hypothetical protein Metus_0733 [Candidatus Methanosuratincola subterraneus]
MAAAAVPADVYSVITSDEQVTKLFEYLVSKKKTAIPPAFEIVMGYHYPDIMEALKLTSVESISFAKKLVQMGLAAEDYKEQVVRCPFCNSEYTTVRFHCPFCNSTRLSKDLLIEHLSDGIIAPFSNYRKGGEAMVCPSCKRPVKEGEYRTVGVWYSCLSCGKQFDTPKNTYLCLGCGKSFTTQELVISSVNELKIKPEILDEFARRHMLLTPLIKIMTDASLDAKSPGTIVGSSGYSHIFSIVCTNKNGKKYAFDLQLSEKPVDETAVLSIFAKVVDTKPDAAYLITIPGIVENGKKIASVYNINIIEGKTIQEVIPAIKEVVSNITKS